MGFLKNPKTILIALVIFKASQVIYALLHPDLISAAPGYRGLELGLLSVAVLFALKHRRWALWLVSVYLFLQLGTLIVGLFIIPLNQFVMKSLSVALGAYFVFGGWVLASMARSVPAVRAEPAPPPDGVKGRHQS